MQTARVSVDQMMGTPAPLRDLLFGKACDAARTVGISAQRNEKSLQLLCDRLAGEFWVVTDDPRNRQVQGLFQFTLYALKQDHPDDALRIAEQLAAAFNGHLIVAQFTGSLRLHPFEIKVLPGIRQGRRATVVWAHFDWAEEAA